MLASIAFPCTANVVLVVVTIHSTIAPTNGLKRPIGKLRFQGNAFIWSSKRPKLLISSLKQFTFLKNMSIALVDYYLTFARDVAH